VVTDSALRIGQGEPFESKLAHSLGLSGEPPTIARRSGAARVGITRLASARSARHNLKGLAREDAFVVSLHLRSVRRRIVWIDGSQVDDVVLPADATCLYDLTSDISADVDGPFDVVLFHIPRAALDYLARENDMPRIAGLNARQGTAVADPAIKSLGHCLVPALEDSQRAMPLFVDELVLAFQFHLIRAYGEAESARSLGGLAPWQRRRATEMMSSDLSRTIQLADVARECRLSVSHFARAFRQSTGLPPYKWLLDRRLRAVKEMMLNSNRPLAEIATDCGFTDQSHLTRVFTSYVGTSPGAWRRNIPALDCGAMTGAD
jgi:AraC family transcriptional regulator